VKSLRAEMTDRYGKPPAAVVRLLRLAELRVAAAQKRLGRIETRENKIYFYLQRERSPLLVKGHLPVLNGKDAEQRLACVFRALQSL